MGYRSYDWECDDCGYRSKWALVWVEHGEDAPRHREQWCDECDCLTQQTRLFPLVGQYMGEKPCNPVVYGGSFDTAGYKPLPSIDPLPNLTEAQMADRNARKERVDQYKERFASPEWKNLTAERAAVRKENAAKRARLRALESGANINMRTDRLPGDPKVTA